MCILGKSCLRRKQLGSDSRTSVRLYKNPRAWGSSLVSGACVVRQGADAPARLRVLLDTCFLHILVLVAVEPAETRGTSKAHPQLVPLCRQHAEIAFICPFEGSRC